MSASVRSQQRPESYCTVDGRLKYYCRYGYGTHTNKVPYDHPTAIQPSARVVKARNSTSHDKSKMNKSISHF